MIFVLYPDICIRSTKSAKADNRRRESLVRKIDAIRSSYNYELETLRDVYSSKIEEAVAEFQKNY